MNTLDIIRSMQSRIKALESAAKNKKTVSNKSQLRKHERDNSISCVAAEDIPSYSVVLIQDGGRNKLPVARVYNDALLVPAGVMLSEQWRLGISSRSARSGSTVDVVLCGLARVRVLAGEGVMVGDRLIPDSGKVRKYYGDDVFGTYRNHYVNDILEAAESQEERDTFIHCIIRQRRFNAVRVKLNGDYFHIYVTVGNNRYVGDDLLVSDNWPDQSDNVHNNVTYPVELEYILKKPTSSSYVARFYWPGVPVGCVGVFARTFAMTNSIFPIVDLVDMTNLYGVKYSGYPTLNYLRTGGGGSSAILYSKYAGTGIMQRLFTKPTTKSVDNDGFLFGVNLRSDGTYDMPGAYYDQIESFDCVSQSMFLRSHNAALDTESSYSLVDELYFSPRTEAATTVGTPNLEIFPNETDVSVYYVADASLDNAIVKDPANYPYKKLIAKYTTDSSGRFTEFIDYTRMYKASVSESECTRENIYTTYGLNSSVTTEIVPYPIGDEANPYRFVVTAGNVLLISAYAVINGLDTVAGAARRCRLKVRLSNGEWFFGSYVAYDEMSTAHISLSVPVTIGSWVEVHIEHPATSGLSIVGDASEVNYKSFITITRVVDYNL